MQPDPQELDRWSAHFDLVAGLNDSAESLDLEHGSWVRLVEEELCEKFKVPQGQERKHCGRDQEPTFILDEQ